MQASSIKLSGYFPFEYNEYEYDLSYSFIRIHFVWTDPNMNKSFYIRLFGIPITAKTCYMASHFLLQVLESDFESFSLPESTAGFRPVMGSGRVAIRVGVMLDLLDVEEIGSGRTDPPEG